MAALSPAARANKYARDVVAGRITACLYVRQACQRQIDDLKKSKSARFKYKFDFDRANRVINFIHLMPHTKGKWAAKGLLLNLEPWQLFITATVFGWVHKKTGLRRFISAYIEVPRKNGKSAWTAGLGIYMMVADGEFGAEVYCGATTQKQAFEVFKPARLMCLKKPKLIQKFGLDIRAENLNRITDGSKFEPLVGDPGDGAMPSFAIVDEFHEHKKPNLIETMQTGMGSREQPLEWIITTAGDNMAGPCYETRGTVINLLAGTIKDDTQFGIIYTTDKGDDWDSPEALKKANPNYGVSVMPAFLETRRKDAQRRPSKRGIYKTKHLNVWVGARDAYFDVDAWIKSANPKLTRDSMAGRGAVAALDLASKKDLCAKMLLFPPLTEGEKWALLPKYYLPAAAIEDEANSHLAAWADAGWITIAGENRTDYGFIEEDLKEDAKLFNLLEVAFDPFQANQFCTRMLDEGLPMVEYANTIANMSDPMKELDALIIDGGIEHTGCPSTAWQFSNVTARTDAKENVFPRKERDENKIDGPVATIFALARAMAQEETGSIFDDPEIWKS